MPRVECEPFIENGAFHSSCLVIFLRSKSQLNSGPYASKISKKSILNWLAIAKKECTGDDRLIDRVSEIYPFTVTCECTHELKMGKSNENKTNTFLKCEVT